ncbi:MAG: ATP-binding cassette domain-containing protein [Phycisphaerae bacterium]
MNNQTVISAVGLTKVFRDFWHRARVRAVNDLDLDIHAGEIFGLLGPNGSGKSTTIKMVLGLLYPTRGRVSVFGRSPDDVRIKNRIGYLPEESYLYRFLNARETLAYYGTLFQLHRRERNRRTEQLLEMVGLRSAARRPVGEYSKGMARRIGLAQALINDPDLLILDEPTSGLDPIGAKLVKDIIVRLGREYRKTILLSTHLLADVEEVCDRVTILFGGRAQVTGQIQDVLSRRDKIQITCDRLSAETLQEIEGVVERREGKSLRVDTPRERLESLFLRIVEEAYAQQLETAGTAPVGEIAGFLGEEEAGRAVLDSLVHVEPEGPPAEAVAEPEPLAQTGAVDEDVLGELTTPAPPPVEEEQPVAASEEKPAAPPPPSDLDRAVLDELTGETGRAGRDEG